MCTQHQKPSGVFDVALFVLGQADPTPRHCLWVTWLVGPKIPLEKDRLLREAILAEALIPSAPPATRKGSVDGGVREGVRQ